MKKQLAHILAGDHLDFKAAVEVMHQILSGKATPSQTAGFLTALRAKGETADEVAGFVSALRSRSLSAGIDGRELVDICGTGGDNGRTFNISTAAGIVAAGAGVKIAKHINRPVSSRSGSADVLLALGIKVDGGPKTVAASIAEVGIGCFFGPIFNPTLTATLGPRRELGFMTVLDLLIPMINPAGAGTLVMGVYPPDKLDLLAEALARHETGRALVFANDAGLDELSLTGINHVIEITGLNMKKYEITAEEAGLSPGSIEKLGGGDADRNAVIISDVLDDRAGPCRDIVAFNAGAAIYATGQVESIKEGVAVALETIGSGKAKNRLDNWKAFSKRVDHR